jgi:GntR family histidine utilization transcriptional repressor
LTAPEFNSWQSVQGEVLRRINSREWKPGDLIPNEADLSREFGCARATVNRALRELAGAGLLERRRKAGTRVATHPVRRATLNIPVIRNEIEGKGQAYRYSLLSAERLMPPPDMRARMQVAPGDELLHLVSVHLADGKPYVFEDRWINSRAVPEVTDVDFSRQSANEWLVENIPFEGGDITFSAMTAGAREAEILGCREGEGLFAIDRTTWNKGSTITAVRLVFAPGYRMHTEI